MLRRTFLTAAAGAAASAAPSASRPNIVLIMADDLGFSDIGCYGSEIATPNLDRLAAGGLRFTNFYNTARCCPTRAALMTGLYSHQAGVGHMMTDDGRPGYRGDLSRQCVTIAEVLKPAGYRTAMTGKWHLTPVTPPEKPDKHNWPMQRGFEKYFGTIAGSGSYYDPHALVDGNEPVRAGKDFYYTDAIGDHASKFIGEMAGGPAPFFLYAAFTAPHWPLHAREEDIAKYKDRYKKGWDELRRQRHARMQELKLVDRSWPLTPRDPEVPAWAEEKHQDWQARRMAVYAAQVDRLDQNIGKILRKLKETGAEENTLVIFLADNGGCAEEFPIDGIRAGSTGPTLQRNGEPIKRGNNPALMPGPEETYQSYGIGWANASNTPFRLYKHWVHEGGISSPLIAYWPKGVTAHGGTTDQTGHVIDILATCADLGKAEYPREFAGNRITPLEGLSLAPVFAGKRRKGHSEIFWEHEGNRAVRQGDWKLVSKYPGDWELFDVRKDRTEMNNLAAAHPEKVRELSAKYDAWTKRANVVPWGELHKQA